MNKLFNFILSFVGMANIRQSKAKNGLTIYKPELITDLAQLGELCEANDLAYKLYPAKIVHDIETGEPISKSAKIFIGPKMQLKPDFTDADAGASFLKSLKKA
jgi:hypothetical protein